MMVNKSQLILRSWKWTIQKLLAKQKKNWEWTRFDKLDYSLVFGWESLRDANIVGWDSFVFFLKIKNKLDYRKFWSCCVSYVYA